MALRNRFVIQTHIGYVDRFSAAHLIVQVSLTDVGAKRFRTAAAAQAFIDKYGDAGFGLVKGKCKIVELEAVPS